jgi:glycosyltransferase involved in cell wall biosynthesis
MKILFLTPRYAPHIGGVEKHLSEVAKILSKNDQVTIVTEQYQKNLLTEEKNQNLKIYRIPVDDKKSKKIQIWKWLFGHLNVLFSADVIHVHDVFYWILPFRFLLFWKKFYITFHGYEAPGPLTVKQIRWHQIAARLTHGNICVGDFHRSIYGLEPTFVTYGGVTSPAVRKNKRNKVKKILFVGRIADDTGVRTYVSALSQLKGKLPFEADFYGEGELRSELRNKVRQHKLQIHFLGRINDPSHLYEKYDLVFASQYLGILQALVFRKPIIAIADSELKEKYLKLTPFADWISIAKNELEVVKLLTNSNQVNTQKSAQVQEWIQDQTWTNLAEKYRQLWKI